MPATEADLKQHTCQTVVVKQNRHLDFQKGAFLDNYHRESFLQQHWGINCLTHTQGTKFINLVVRSRNEEDVITGQINRNLNKTILSIKNDPSYLDLFQKYQSELKRKDVQNGNSDATFENLAFQLYQINYKTASVELTARKSLKFTFGLDESKTLMISKSFVDNVNDNVVIFSIFENRELILSDASEISDLVKGIKKRLSL